MDLEKLLKFEAPFLEDKLLQDGVFENATDYNEAFGEFKRFAYVATISDEPVAMTSTVVDDVWHQFILFTKEYANFCDDYLGGFMHHSPHISTTKSEDINHSIVKFVELYSDNFGEVSTIWTGGCSSGGCSGGTQCASCATRCGGGCSGVKYDLPQPIAMADTEIDYSASCGSRCASCATRCGGGCSGVQS